MNTERLYAQSDAARDALAVLDRIIAGAKDEMRGTLLQLTHVTDVEDADGRCFSAILEAIDDLMMEARDEIRERMTEADEAISDIEWADLQRSAPMVA